MPLSRLPNATPFFPQLCAAPWFSLNRRARAPIGFTARRHSPPQGQKIGGPHIPAQSFRASITDRIVGHLGFLRENEVAGNGLDARRNLSHRQSQTGLEIGLMEADVPLTLSNFSGKFT